MTAGDAPRNVVLDTQVVLDWLWFDDPRVKALGAAIVARRLRWLANGEMRAEFAHVLDRLSTCAGRPPEPALTSFDALATRATHPVSQRHEPPAWVARPPSAVPRCADPTDQMFIDLAADTGAVLLSRDRAVLKLARPMAALGCRVCAPEAFRLP